MKEVVIFTAVVTLKLVNVSVSGK